MANQKTTQDSASETAVATEQFVLKHRIVGAATLLFFGALVLPWILGSPGKPTGDSDVQAATQSSDGSEGFAQRELDDLIADAEQEIDEQVYISRITPLDADNESSEPQSSPVPEPAESPLEPEKSAPTPLPEVSEQAEQPEQPKPAQPQQSEPETDQLAKADVKPQPAAEETEKPAAPSTSEIEVGWVVQVGVFVDKRGAARVVDDLKNKGFTPTTAIVDTNRGKDTGTRIWLGPYAQRVDAAKAKAELTAKTGEAGYIRSFP